MKHVIRTLLFCVLLSIVGVFVIHEIVYRITEDYGLSLNAALLFVSSLLSGFALESRGSWFNEKRKTTFAVINIVMACGGILYCLIWGTWYYLFIPIAIVLICPGFGGLISRALFRAGR